MDDKKRLYATEREILFRLAIMVDFAEELKHGLDERSKLRKGLRRKVGLLSWLTQDMLTEFCSTVPTEQLVSLQRNIRSVSICTGVKCASKSDRRDEYGLFLSFDEIHTLVDAIMEGKCMMCMEEQEYRCPVKKVLDMLGNDAEDDENPKHCKWKFMV